MGTSLDYTNYVCEQIQGVGDIRYKKMFGEYMIYVNDKPILLVCDDTVYVKKLDCIAGKMAKSDTGNPYKGAREHYILDIEDSDLCKDIILTLEKVIPIPKPRKKAEKQTK